MPLINYIILCFLIFVTQTQTDVYLPSLPQIADYFKASENLVGFTVGINLLGAGLSSLFLGPLSDVYGRRPILIAGSSIFVLSSLLSCFAGSIDQLIGFRFLQGLGAGVAFPVGQASIQDSYHGPHRAQMLSRLSMICAVSPAIGPIIGSEIAARSHWQKTFELIFIAGSLSFIALIVQFKESLPLKAVHLPINKLLETYQGLFKCPKVLVYGSIQLLAMFWLLGDLTSLPYIYQRNFKLPEHDVGLYMAAGVGIFILGSLVNQWAVLRYRAHILVFLGLVLGFFGAFCLLLALLFFQIKDPLLLVLLKSPSNFGLAFIFGNTSAQVMAAAQGSAGTAAALLASLQTASATLGIALASYFVSQSTSLCPMSFVLGACSGLGMFLIFLLKRESQSRPAVKDTQ